MRRRIVPIILLLTIGLVGCQSVTEVPAQSTPTVVLPEQPPVLPNLLIATNARVEIRRKDSLTAVPVTLGTELTPGDVLELKEGSAAIFCGAETDWDSNPRPLAIGQHFGVPCGIGRPPRPYPDATTVRGRGGETPVASDEILVLSPRSGWVLQNRPILVWTEIAGATRYTVTLQSDDYVVRTTSATGSPLPYPQEWESLQAEGASYNLVVESGDKSSGDNTPGFSRLETSDEFSEKVERLQHRPVEEPARTLLLVELYLSYGLRSEAVELLVALPNADAVIAVQNLVGETYLNMGLVVQGQAAYTRMAELAQTQGFVESQAQALLGLGWAACAVRDLAVVTTHWSQAQAIFEEQGSAAQVEAVKVLLREKDKTCG